MMTQAAMSKRKKPQRRSIETAGKAFDDRSLIDSAGERAELAGAQLARKFITSLEAALGIEGVGHNSKRKHA
jgi:predicted ATPase